jgi:hypothetical protein
MEEEAGCRRDGNMWKRRQGWEEEMVRSVGEEGMERRGRI